MRIARPAPAILAACTAAALLLGAAGCGDAAEDPNAPFETVFNPCEPLVVQAQGELSEKQSTSLDQAIALWNTAAPLKLTRTPVENAPVIPLYFKDGAGFVHGFYSDKEGTVTINQKLNARGSMITLTHELGHAFGLHHVSRDSRHSVMNPGNLKTEPTTEDVTRLMYLWPSCGEDAPDES